MSESRSKLEEILELLLAEENEKAEELLHEYVVAKARAEYEKVLDEEVAEESDEVVEEATKLQDKVADPKDPGMDNNDAPLPSGGSKVEDAGSSFPIW